jgi:hypothetical protein
MDKVYYNYRYFLPYPQLWGSLKHCDQRLDELLQFCRDAKIDAVQFFVNTRYATYYMPPASVEEQHDWINWMNSVVRPAVMKQGISYQLNFQMILGGGGWGQDISSCYDWEFMVNQFGKQAEGCPCPHGKNFRAAMGPMLQGWASTQPEVIWIDDDFRLHNHIIDKSQGMDFYCFCDEHLARFAEFIGTFYFREEIVSALTKPTKLRKQWLEFCGNEMVEFAGWINEQIHVIAPECRIALMTSLNDIHSFEGRDWTQTLTALCQPHKPMTRPCCGIYSSNQVALKDNTVTFQLFEQSKVLLDSLLGKDNIEYGPELENSRFTSWSNSMASSRYVLETGQILGMKQITISVSDLEGSPIDDEPGNLKLLTAHKARLQAIADLNLENWQPIGLTAVIDPNIAAKMEHKLETSLGRALPQRSFEPVLLQMGVPMQYALPDNALKLQTPLLLDASTVWCFSDDDLLKTLSGAVLMDAEGALTIQKRGMSKYLGVQIGCKKDFAIQSEIYYPGILDGVESFRCPHKGFDWYEMHITEAKKCSDFLVASGDLLPGSTVFTNSLGGRIVVYAKVGDCMPYANWGNHARKRWLNSVMKFLYGKHHHSIQVNSISQGIMIARQCGNKQLIAFANLSADKLESLEFIPASKYHQWQWLNGVTWTETDLIKTKEKLLFQGGIMPFEWLVMIGQK